MTEQISIPSREELVQIVNDLYNGYKDNDVIFNKFTEYIKNFMKTVFMGAIIIRNE